MERNQDLSPYGLAAATCEALRAIGWRSGTTVESNLRKAIRSGNFDDVHPRVKAQLDITRVVLEAYFESTPTPENPELTRYVNALKAFEAKSWTDSNTPANDPECGWGVAAAAARRAQPAKPQIGEAVTYQGNTWVVRELAEMALLKVGCTTTWARISDLKRSE